VDLVLGGFRNHTLTPCIVDRQGNFHQQVAHCRRLLYPTLHKGTYS
jgi:hypothetical protein